MHTIVVRPNRSLHQAELGLLGLGLLAALTLGGVLTWRFGFWPILAFDALALIGLLWATWSVDRAGGYLERICIDDDWVTISQGIRAPESGFRVHRGWARLIEDAGGPWKRHRIWIGASGRVCEVGACLGDEEKRELSRQLRRYLCPTRSPGSKAHDPGNFTDGSITEFQAGDFRI
ncbi:MAG: DUF2244 domain-containing protein [Gammaproteobacteria bacterium]